MEFVHSNIIINNFFLFEVVFILLLLRLGRLLFILRGLFLAIPIVCHGLNLSFKYSASYDFLIQVRV
jgi:hypothetical protein